MSKKGGCRSSGNRSHRSHSSGNRSHKSKSSGDRSHGHKSSRDRSNGHKSSGDRSYGYKSYGDRNDGNKSYGDRSDGNKSSGSKSGVHGILLKIGVGTPNIRVHFNGTFHTGVFLGIIAGCVVLNVKGVVCYITISSITAVDVGCVEKKKKKRKFKCRKK